MTSSTFDPKNLRNAITSPHERTMFLELLSIMPDDLRVRVVSCEMVGRRGNLTFGSFLGEALWDAVVQVEKGGETFLIAHGGASTQYNTVVTDGLTHEQAATALGDMLSMARSMRYTPPYRVEFEILKNLQEFGRLMPGVFERAMRLLSMMTYEPYGFNVRVAPTGRSDNSSGPYHTIKVTVCSHHRQPDFGHLWVQRDGYFRPLYSGSVGGAPLTPVELRDELARLHRALAYPA